MRNNPLNFTDPTGHRECGALDDCSDPLPPDPTPTLLPFINFGGVDGEIWSAEEQALVMAGAWLRKEFG